MFSKKGGGAIQGGAADSSRREQKMNANQESNVTKDCRTVAKFEKESEHGNSAARSRGRSRSRTRRVHSRAKCKSKSPPNPAVPVHILSFNETQATTEMYYARRVSVGMLPDSTTEESLKKFLSDMLDYIGGNTGGGVLKVIMYPAKRSALLELSCMQEAANMLCLNGINFKGSYLSIERDAKYRREHACLHGPVDPSPGLNLAGMVLTPDWYKDQNCICVKGLPYQISEAQVRYLMEAFGQLKWLELAKDVLGNFKGLAFCVYEDTSKTDEACAGLNGLNIGHLTLKVSRKYV